MTARPPTAGRRRAAAGFTLIELLVVILIIGVLVALLVPVIFGAVRTANEARVTAEINLLAQSLASFKSNQGDYPPSRIILREDGFYDNSGNTNWTNAPIVTLPGMTNSQSIGGTAAPLLGTPDLAYAQLAERSVHWLRKVFPRAEFSTSGRVFLANAPPSKFHDFNGNGQLDEGAIVLQGHECLVFFLGGIPNYFPANPPTVPQTLVLSGLSGFGPDPKNPFLSEAAVNSTGKLVAANNRKRPLFDFQADRLIEDDGDGMPGYVDTLARNESARYYAYFSAYGGGGYDPNDVNFAITNPEDDLLAQRFRVNFNVPPPADNRLVDSPAPNPYTSSPSAPGGTAVASYVSGETFQLISAGTDRLYGAGGQYLPSANSDRLPVGGLITDPGLRLREADNLSSFSSGKFD